MPKKRTFYSEEERKAHHEKKQREADLQIQELTKHWENDPKDIAEYLAFSTQFYKYSLRNTMLIYRQRPDSVFIASYTHWKELGYYVQEGEHGANIYRPETTRYFKPNVPNPTWVLLSKASPEQRHEVEIGMLESRDFTYFKPCTVFDISQTNCPPEDYPKLCGVGYNSTQHKDIYNTLCLYSEEIGVPVSEEDFEGIGTRGAYNPRNKHIHINQLLGDTQKLDTLLHEMSHHLMGHSPNIEKPTMQREFEADGLSIMFGKTFGIEPSDARKSHLAACYQELLKAQPEVKIDALLAPVREKFQQHIEAMEQELSLAGVIPQQIISSQKAAELKREQAMKKEPTVTVIWTESKRLHDGQTMRLSRANELFKAIDKAQQKYPNCYHKAAFRIDYMLHGEPSSYEGRQSFGTGEGSLIDHIKRLNTLCNENPQWENYLLETGGSDALLQDRHEKEYILNEFIPYLNLHVTLSEIEQSVSEKLGETDELTLERSEQFAALQQNVRTVRAMLNQGNYDFSVAQINELSPKFAEWMRQISKKSIQQSSENKYTVTLTKTSADVKITNGNANYSLEGAVYNVYKAYVNPNHDYANDPVIATFTTDANGKATLSRKLENGDYVTIEQVAPLGYTLDKNVHRFSINGKSANLDVVDDPTKIRLTVRKKDADTNSNVPQGDATLEGAQYRITYTNNDEKIENIVTTNKSGQAVLRNIPIGVLVTVEEIGVPLGYKLDSKVHTYITTTDTKELEYDLIPEDFTEEVMKGQIALHKQYETLDEPADEQGAEFDVYLKSAGSFDAAKETERDHITTGADGMATTKDLPYGTYVVHQTKGGNGRQLVADFDVSISEDGKVYSYDLVNIQKNAQLKIVKTSEDGVVEGIHFRVTRLEDML